MLNMQSVDKSVESYESNIEVTKWFRDRSADGLMVGAAVMSGPAAVGWTAAGSAFKGIYKYQDSGSIGGAVMEGAGSFAFAKFKLGKEFSFKENMYIAFVQADYKYSTEIISGKSLNDAQVSGSLQLLGPVVDSAFDLGPAKTIFDKVALPFAITYANKNVASELLRENANEWVKSGAEILANRKNASSQNESTDEVPSSGTLVNAATITNKHLLYCGIVNMKNGIGRGW